MNGLDCIRCRLSVVLMETAVGVFVWRRPDPTIRMSLWRRTVVRVLSRVVGWLWGVA